MLPWDFSIARSLTQQCAGRYIAKLGHIILIPSQTVFDDACLVKKQHIPNLPYFALTQHG